ncbi:hypothetical protein ACO3VM_02690 [Methanocaldococcus sp. 10A]
MAKILISDKELAFIVKKCFEEAKKRFNEHYEYLSNIQYENEDFQKLCLYLSNNVNTRYFGENLTVDLSVVVYSKEAYEYFLKKKALHFNISCGILAVYGYWDTTKDVTFKKLTDNLYLIEIPEVSFEMES